MLVSYYTKRKIKRSLFIGLVTTSIGVGFFFEYLNLHTITPYGILFGFLFGLVLGLTEEFILFKFLRRSNYLLAMILKFNIYILILLSLFTIEILFYSHFFRLDITSLSSYLKSSKFILPFIYALFVYDYIIVFMYVENLLGSGRFMKYVLGAYRKPTGEDRIFMFIDMNKSTELAENLGEIEYFNLINDCFHDLSVPVQKTRAEIYQFVGDEVVITWKMEEGLMHSHCVKAFFLFEDILKKRRKHYLADYGVLPSFKAGLHCGHVLAAEIGDLKKEIVYNGDVLNTAARIRSKCGKQGKKLLLSKKLLDLMPMKDNGIKSEFHFTPLGPVSLKGKQNPIELFSVDRAGERKKDVVGV